MEQGIDDRSLPEVDVDKFSFDEDVLRKEMVEPIVSRIQEAVKAGNAILRDENLYRLVHVFRETVRALPESKETVLKVIFEGFRRFTGEDEESALRYTSRTQLLYAMFTEINDLIPHHERVSFVPLEARKDESKVLLEKWVPDQMEVPDERLFLAKLDLKVEALLNVLKAPNGENAAAYRVINQLVDQFVSEHFDHSRRIYELLFESVRRRTDESEEEARRPNSRTKSIYDAILTTENGVDHNEVAGVGESAVTMDSKLPLSQFGGLRSEGLGFVKGRSQNYLDNT